MEEKWIAMLQKHKTARILLVLVLGGITAYFFCRLLTVLMVSGYGTYLVYLGLAVIVSLSTRRWLYGIIMAVLSALVQFWLQPEAFYLSQVMSREFVLDGTIFLLIGGIECWLLWRLYQQSELELPSHKNMRRLRERNEYLRARREEAESEVQQEKMRSDLLRAVSHDLRTPLTSIAGASSILARQGEEMPSEERQDLYESIHEEALWLNHMVENLLSVTKMSNEKIQLHKNVELVEEIFQETMMKFRRRMPEQEVEVLVPLEEILMVPMDAMLIEQVLLNLLENAVRHSYVSAPITLSAVGAADGVLFCVRDRGQGIAEEDMERFFQG